MANNGKKERRRALLDAEIAADPAVRRGKRLTAALLILWISARLFYLVMELICAKVGYFDFDAAGFVFFALSLLCAALMYRGMRYYSVLFLLLGALMILNTFLGRAYSALGLDLYLDLKLYYVSCVLDAWVQTAVMLCLLLSPCCRRYAEAAGRIREDLAYKGYRPQVPVSDTPEAEKNGGINFDDFVDAINDKLGDKESKEGIRRIFDLFIDDPNADTITLSSLKKISKELGENMSDEELKDMLERASKNGVELTFEEFYDIMTKKSFP